MSNELVFATVLDLHLFETKQIQSFWLLTDEGWLEKRITEQSNIKLDVILDLIMNDRIKISK